MMRTFLSVAIFGLLIGAATGTHAADKAGAGVDLVGQPFPMLIARLESSEPATPGASPCDTVRALRLDELDEAWKTIVAKIALTCEVGTGIENEPDANTTVVAKLKPKAAHFDGIPIIEVRMMDSAWGNDYQYVLDARFRVVKQRLAAAIRAHCKQNLGVPPDAPDHPDSCPVQNDGAHGGIYIDTGEGGGLWAHPDSDNPRRTIFASAWSE